MSIVFGEVTDIPVHLSQKKKRKKKKRLNLDCCSKGERNEAVPKSRKLSGDEKSAFRKKKRP